MRREVPARYEAVQHFPPASTGFDTDSPKARRPRFLQRSIVPLGVPGRQSGFRRLSPERTVPQDRTLGHSQ